LLLRTKDKKKNEKPTKKVQFFTSPLYIKKRARITKKDE
jgi:hypothetical protein